MKPFGSFPGWGLRRPHPLFAVLLWLGSVAGGAQEGAPSPDGTSNLRNPRVVFATPGVKTVTLTVCNAAGCSSRTKTVTVLDPRPAISSTEASPVPVQVAQLVLLSARATGRPDLSYAWTIRSGSTVVATLQGNPVWWKATAPGSYSAAVVVTNHDGSATASVAIAAVANEKNSFFTIAPCRLFDSRTGAPFTPASASRRLVVAGLCNIPTTATAIAANLTAVAPGSGGVFELTPGPALGTAQLSFRAGVTRSAFAVLPLSISQDLTAYVTGLGKGTSVHLVVDATGYTAPTRPNLTQFVADACAGLCVYPAGVPLSFRHHGSGIATTWRYDWDGNGSFEQTAARPVTSHSFGVGFFVPRVEASGSAGSSTLAHDGTIVTQAFDSSRRPTAPTFLTAAYQGLAAPGDDLARTGNAPSWRLSAVAPTGLVAFNVYLSRAGGSFSHLATLPSLATSFVVDPAPTAGESLRVYLTAVSGVSESLPSAVVGLAIP